MSITANDRDTQCYEGSRERAHAEGLTEAHRRAT